jgi:RNA polymerase sigma factor (sigma-70 family)
MHHEGAVNTSTTPRASVPLRAVPEPGTSEYEDFIAEVLAEEDVSERELAARNWQPDALDEALLAEGLPVAFPYGDQPPELPDEDADVHEAAVRSIEHARLHRYIRQLPPADSKALRLYWGLGGAPHSQGEVAERMGLTHDAVRWMLNRAMRALRVQYGVDLADHA